PVFLQRVRDTHETAVRSRRRAGKRRCTGRIRGRNRGLVFSQQQRSQRRLSACRLRPRVLLSAWLFAAKYKTRRNLSQVEGHGEKSRSRTGAGEAGILRSEACRKRDGDGEAADRRRGLLARRDA